MTVGEMLQRYGALVLGRASAKKSVVVHRRFLASEARKKPTPGFATSAGRKPLGGAGAKDPGGPAPFADDPSLQSLLKFQKWEEEEGPDPTPEELEEENKMAEDLSEEDRKYAEDMEKASVENLLSFIDMDHIAEHTGQKDMFTKPIAKYEGKFVDSRGEIPIELTRSDNELTMKARGFRFMSYDMVLWELPGAYSLLARDVFTLTREKEKTIAVSVGAEDAQREGPRDLLDKFMIEFFVPVKIARLDEEGREIADRMKLAVRVVRDSEVSADGVFKMRLTLPDGTEIESDAKNRFADAMFQLQTQLPNLQYFKNCWGCANSEFSPLQRRPYGSMPCFRKKPKHFVFRTNGEIIRNWSKVEEVVQELHLCSSFRRRTTKRPEPVQMTFAPIE